MNREEKQFLVYRFLINKMLKPHGVDWDYVMAHQQIEGQPWFQYYTWTQEESDAWKKDAIDYVRKTLHLSKKSAEYAVAMMNLNHGLKIVNQ